MPAPRSLSAILSEVRSQASSRNRRVRLVDASTALACLISHCRTLAVQGRVGGISFQLAGETEQHSPFAITCVLHVPHATQLTTAETAVVQLLLEGCTRSQIARHRRVTVNTIKTQIRQIYRKLNVDSRVALARQWIP
jgi:DNA-binding NarL/FixJ family response regulator